MKNSMEIAVPIIGVFAGIDDEHNTSVLYPYISAIEKSYGLPILIPYIENADNLKKLINLCDGIFFTGGVDINPKLYGCEKSSQCGKIEIYRDKIEFLAFSIALKLKKPILGVCRGAQLINVALGGTLYQDINSEISTEISHIQVEPKTSHSHEIVIKNETPLFELLGKNRIKANSFHHQAIKKLGKHLKIMANADDGIVEAFYMKDEVYLRAYQWHPERLCNIDENNKMIFYDFIKDCINNKNKKEV